MYATNKSYLFFLNILSFYFVIYGLHKLIHVNYYNKRVNYTFNIVAAYLVEYYDNYEINGFLMYLNQYINISNKIVFILYMFSGFILFTYCYSNFNTLKLFSIIIFYIIDYEILLFYNPLIYDEKRIFEVLGLITLLGCISFINKRT